MPNFSRFRGGERQEFPRGEQLSPSVGEESPQLEVDFLVFFDEEPGSLVLLFFFVEVVVEVVAAAGGDGATTVLVEEELLLLLFLWAACNSFCACWTLR